MIFNRFSEALKTVVKRHDDDRDISPYSSILKWRKILQEK